MACRGSGADVRADQHQLRRADKANTVLLSDAEATSAETFIRALNDTMYWMRPLTATDRVLNGLTSDACTPRAETVPAGRPFGLGENPLDFPLDGGSELLHEASYHSTHIGVAALL